MSSRFLASKREAATSRPVNTSVLRRSHREPDFAARRAIPSTVHSVLHGPGESLDPATRGFMQAGFNHDFSGVRVHTGAQAARSADEMQARAYTVGRNIVFGRGAFAPHSHEGCRLIAHELTHVVQNEKQPASGPSLKEVSAPDDASEREAHLASQRVVDRDGAHVSAKPAGVVQRDGLATGLGIAGGVVGAGLLGLGIAKAVGAFDSKDKDPAKGSPGTAGTAAPQQAQTSSKKGSVSAIDVITSPSGAYSGFAAIPDGGSLDSPGPFNDLVSGSCKNIHQIKFTLAGTTSADVSLTRKVDRKNTAAIPGPPPYKGPDGPSVGTVLRPDEKTVVVADSPGYRGHGLTTPFPITYDGSFELYAFDNIQQGVYAKLTYKVAISKKTIAEQNPTNQITITSKTLY